ncbi:hypothetical protein [Klebsiella pneumoniae]|uniref:hypothetical protein n=1 Tax=Klebsiella pneumoniae TaxID=573 RepID=UPI0020CCAAD1|nr:hypothetical protein [Klebsiella pneumoniae]MCQ0496604.1 hypothetical protein [Klebsiella pneumoniae]
MLLINPVAMTNPGDAPHVPDLLKNLFLNFNAALDTAHDNNAVETVTMRGNATGSSKIWSSLRGDPAVMTKPTAMNSGGESFLRFAGTNSLAMALGATYVTSPLSFALRLRVPGSWSSVPSTIGVLRGMAGRNLSLFTGGSEGTMRIGYGVDSGGVKSTTISGDVATNQFDVFSASYAGDGLINWQFGSKSGQFEGEPSSIQQLGLGCSLDSANTAGAIFDLSHLCFYDRVLYPEEQQAIREIWNAKGDIES